jgi:hypothetical protein
MSPRYLRAIFATSNETVSAYILRRRLEECARELADPRARAGSITEIAFGWGFNSAPHFTRSFRERYGMSPRQYRTCGASRASRRARTRGARRARWSDRGSRARETEETTHADSIGDRPARRRRVQRRLRPAQAPQSAEQQLGQRAGLPRDRRRRRARRCYDRASAPTARRRAGPGRAARRRRRRRRRRRAAVRPHRARRAGPARHRRSARAQSSTRSHAKITSLRSDALGRLSFVLDNGQVWRMTESEACSTFPTAATRYHPARRDRRLPARLGHQRRGARARAD